MNIPELLCAIIVPLYITYLMTRIFYAMDHGDEMLNFQSFVSETWYDTFLSLVLINQVKTLHK